MNPTKLILLIEGIVLAILTAGIIVSVLFFMKGYLVAIFIGAFISFIFSSLVEDFTRLWQYKERRKKPLGNK